MRPFVHLNFAIDQRGKYCSSDGMPLSISCEQDWQRVHSLREQYDAVAVGGRTWSVDHPSLSVRSDRLGRRPSRQPARVVFAGNHPWDAGQPGTPVYLIAYAPLSEAPGVSVIQSYGYNLEFPLNELWNRGIRSILVEGGPMLFQSFFQQDCFDLITVFVRGIDPEQALTSVMEKLPAIPLPMEGKLFGEGFLLTHVREKESPRFARYFQATA